MENKPEEYTLRGYTMEQLLQRRERLQAEWEHMDDTETQFQMQKDIIRHEREEVEHEIIRRLEQDGTGTE